MIDNKPTTVDAYIQSCAENVRTMLNEVRSIILQALPDASESLKWGQPAYSYETIMVSFAAHKNHMNFYTTPSTIRALESDLARYKIGKGSIQFPYNIQLPKTLIKKVIEYRLKEYKEQGIKWM